MEPWREELYHHGVLGQKWGQRFGPPYPLNAAAKARKRKAHGSDSSGNNSKVKDIKTGPGGGGGGGASEEDKEKEELIKELSELTGMKESEIKKLIEYRIGANNILNPNGETTGNFLSYNSMMRRIHDKSENTYKKVDNILEKYISKKEAKTKSEKVAKENVSSIVKGTVESSKIINDIRSVKRTNASFKDSAKSNPNSSLSATITKISNRTGMKETEVQRLINYAVNGKSDDYYTQLFGLSEGDSKQAEIVNKMVTDYIKESKKNEASVVKHSSSYELYHHGIDGMKWGTRNGPPYPLYRQSKFRFKLTDRRKAQVRSEERAKRKKAQAVKRAERRAANEERIAKKREEKQQLKARRAAKSILAPVVPAPLIPKTARYPNKVQSDSNRKNVKNMSDQELNNAIKRLENEKRYLELSGREVSQGKLFMENMMEKVGTQTINSFVTSFATNVGTQLGKKVSDEMFENMKSDKK